MDNEYEPVWICGWENIGKYFHKSARTAQSYARQGMPVLRDHGGRPMARKDQIDRYIVELNREMHDDGQWEGSGIEEAIEMIDKDEKQMKEFEEKFLHAQRPPRSRY